MISQYIAPEYLTDNVVSTMNDVYAFGTTLLETISGVRRRRSQPRHFQLHQWVCVHMHHNMDLLLFITSLCKKFELNKNCAMRGERVLIAYNFVQAQILINVSLQHP
jgi:hypothetical protein